MGRRLRQRWLATRTADTIAPSGHVLTATPGVGEVALSWTAATDDLGVTEYEVWRDTTYLATVTAGTFSYTVTGLVAGVSHAFKVVAYDAARNPGNSNIVTTAALAASGSVFTETFETGAFGSSWDAAVISGTGTITVVAAAARTGSFGAKITKPLNDATCYRRKTFTATDTVRASGSYRWLSDSGDINTNGTGPRLFAGANRMVDVYRRDGNGEIWLRYQSTTANTGAGALFVNTGQVVALNTWAKLDVQVDYFAGANSRIRVWVNDILRIDQTGRTIFSGGYTAFQVGAEHTVQFLDVHIDDITIDTAPSGAVSGGTTYYVSATGSNSANGTSEATPWQTVAKVNSMMGTFQPGDQILFKRGGQWNEALNATCNGTSTDRILFGAYGTGTDPIFDGGGNFANGNPLNPIPGPWPTKGTREPITLAGNWLIAEEFIVQQASYAGLRITGDDNIARNFTARWNVAGFFCTSTSARYEVHNFELADNAVMSVNAPGGDDDSGAFGMLLHGQDGNVHHGTSHGHRATSHDYGVDGSTCEIYGGKRNVVHHITSWDDEAFTEIGNPASEDTTYHHCVFYALNLDGLIGFNIQGSPWGSPLRTKIHHCTVYLPAGGGNQGILFNTVTSWAASTAYSVGTRRAPSLTTAKANGHIYEVTVAGTSSGTEPTWPTNGGTVTDGTVTWIDRGFQAEVYNNIIHASWKSGFFGMPGDENNNLYFGHTTQQVKSINNANPASSGVGTASKLGQNPLFVSTSTPDLHLQSGSPAVNAGVSKGYTTDRDDLPRAVGTPDMGAFERQ